MASVASQLIEEVTAHAQSDSLEDAPETCADGTYFPNNLRIYVNGIKQSIWNKAQWREGNAMVKAGQIFVTNSTLVLGLHNSFRRTEPFTTNNTTKTYSLLSISIYDIY